MEIVRNADGALVVPVQAGRHDHDDDAEASVMEGLETAILDRLGIADPYGGGAG